MKTAKRQLGDLGEKVALKYLAKQGYQILDKNWQKPWGEIDLVVKNKVNEIIFIEVKTGEKAEENVHFKKQQRLIKTAQTYLLEKNYSPDTNWQIDVIIVALDKQTKKANCRHIKNAVF